MAQVKQDGATPKECGGAAPPIKFNTQCEESAENASKMKDEVSYTTMNIIMFMPQLVELGPANAALASNVSRPTTVELPELKACVYMKQSFLASMSCIPTEENK